MCLASPGLAKPCGDRSPSPLDCDKLAEAARADAPTVLLATPTFLRQYLKRIPRDAFGTLRRVVSGAEKSFQPIFVLPFVRASGVKSSKVTDSPKLRLS
jgi:hypothetical protein